MLNIILIFAILFIIIYSIWDIKEGFYIGGNYLWMPTRSTRLMSYDLRGDPFGYYIYPSYLNWGAPFRYYVYNPSRYNIFGKYIIQKPRGIKLKEKKIIQQIENRVQPKSD